VKNQSPGVGFAHRMAKQDKVFIRWFKPTEKGILFTSAKSLSQENGYFAGFTPTLSYRASGWTGRI
jgi:hypothetical protein